MSILDKKGISVTSGFKLVSGQPLDARNVVDDLDGLQDLINNGAAYEGIVVYVKSEQQLKQYNGSEWNNVYPESDIITVNSLPNIENAKLDKIYRVPKLLISFGTALPNTGTVGNIHFNTTLSIKQVEDILNELTFTGEAYLVLAASDETPVIVVYKHTDPEGMLIRSEGSGILWANEGVVQNYASTYGITHAGWQEFDNPIVLNEEVKATAGGASVGTQNGLLTSLIFTDPFSETIVGFTYHRRDGNNWIEVLNGGYGGSSSSGSSDFVNVDELPDVFVGTEVPSSGMVEKIYFNTNLSNDEIKGIVYSIVPQNLGELGTLYPICTNSTMTNALVINTYGTYNQNRALVNVVNGVSNVLWNTTDKQSLDVTEVSLSYENYLSLLAPQFGVTVQNDKLKNLISITPYTINTNIKLEKIYRVNHYDGDTIPNTGYVEKVYFNTNLSVKEVDNILSKLTYDENKYVILENENSTIKLIAQKLLDVYSIYDEISNYTYFINDGTISGWNSFPNPIFINSNVLNTVGEQNNILNKLCYIKKESNASINSCSYYRLINYKWEKVLNLFEMSEDLPIIIKKDSLSLPNSADTITQEEFEILYNQPNVIIKCGSAKAISESIYTKTAAGFLSETEKIVIFTNVDGSGHLTTYEIVNNNGNITVTTISTPYITHIFFNQDEENIYVSTYNSQKSIPKATTITDSTDVPTSKAVKTYVDEQVANAGGGSGNIVDVETLPEVSSADLDKIYRVSEKKVINGTAIPNSGTISSLYFNTALTNEKIKEIINQLQWIDGATLGSSGVEFYPILAYMNGDYPYALIFQRYTAGEYTGITNLFIINFATMEPVYNFFVEVSGGWQPFENPYPINATALPELSGISLGYQNELLKTLISSSPFEKELIGYKYYRVINNKWVEVLGETQSAPEMYIIEKNNDDIKNNTLTFTPSEWEIIRNNPNVKVRSLEVEGDGSNTVRTELLFEKSLYGNTGIADLVLFQSCSANLLSQAISLLTLTVIRYETGQHTSIYSEINLTELANGS